MSESAKGIFIDVPASGADMDRRVRRHRSVVQDLEQDRTMANVSLSSRNASNEARKLAGSIDLPELMQVLGIDENLRQQGQQLVEILDEHGEAIFSEFYERIGHISWAHKFKDGEIEPLKKKQFAHWRMLFSGRLDIQYVRNATMVGAVHRQIGIEPLLYIIGYGIVKSAILEIIARKDLPSVNKGRLMVALERYISLDVGLAMVGYSGHNVFAQLFAPGLSA